MTTRNTETEPDDFEYATRVDVNIAILREIAKIRLRERLPRVMAGVAQHLIAAGVDFSKVDYSRITEPTEADLNAIYEDLI
jgi:hypothetical protein